MPSRSRVSEDESDGAEWPGERGIGGQREGIGLGLAPAVVVVVTVGVAVRGWRQRGGERFLVSTNLEGPLFSFLFFLETDSGCSQFFFASPIPQNSFLLAVGRFRRWSTLCHVRHTLSLSGSHLCVSAALTAAIQASEVPPCADATSE